MLETKNSNLIYLSFQLSVRESRGKFNKNGHVGRLRFFFFFLDVAEITSCVSSINSIFQIVEQHAFESIIDNSDNLFTNSAERAIPMGPNSRAKNVFFSFRATKTLSNKDHVLRLIGPFFFFWKYFPRLTEQKSL